MFTYKSYRKGSDRAFDHLYDPNFVANQTKINKLNRIAILKTAPLHIIPCFYNMFSEIRQNKFCFPQRNGLPFDTNNYEARITSKIPTNYNLFSVQNDSILKPTFRLSKNENFGPKASKRNVKSQTTYRESEIQTDPYLPDPKLRANELKLPEILHVDCNNKPYLEDVLKIERNRIRKKFEESIRDAPISMDYKFNQIKIFEWESYLLREKEFNDMQFRRMEYVTSKLEERMEDEMDYCKYKAFNIYKTCSLEKVNKIRKCEEKADRRLRKFKFGTEYEVNPLKNNFLCRTKSLEFAQEGACKLEINDKIQKISSIKKYYLWTPKQKVKDFGHSLKSEKSRFKLYESIKAFNTKMSKKSSLRCRKIRNCEDNQSLQDDHVLLEDSNYRNHICIQKTVKGAHVQKNMTKGIEKNRRDIHLLRRQFPLNCITDVLGEDALPKSESELDIEKVPEKVIDEEKNHDDLEKIISEILNQAMQIIELINNRKILKTANEERQRRQSLAEAEALRQKIALMREESIRDKSENFYKNLIEEVKELIIPLVVEEISEKEAVQFVMQKAAEKSSEASSEKEKFKDFLTEILLPHIESQSHGSDEHLVALLGSYDAFNKFIEKYLSIKQ